MSEVIPLTETELQAALTELLAWRIEDGKLSADFKFSTFVEAFAFMTTVAFAAEAANHHPTWCNVYDRVRIDLVTHDAGDAISHRDVALARQISTLAAPFAHRGR